MRFASLSQSGIIGCVARTCLAVLIVLVARARGPCYGSESSPLAPPQAALLGGVQFSQRLNAQLPLDAQLTDDRGRRVTLAECIDGRPTIFVLAYYRCPMLCNQVLNGLAQSLQAIDFAPGKDISVVVVSFDPSDTVELAADKKKAVLGAYRKSRDGAGWHFLIGDKEVVARLAETVGFQYQYDEASQQFAHASGIVVLTSGGKASRYFYGIDYPTRDVRLGLVEASTGKIGSLADEILLFCFHYDPLTGRYGLAIMRVIRAGGVATVAGLACFIGLSLRRERRLKKKTSHQGTKTPEE